jgi:hypothetical protein
MAKKLYDAAVKTGSYTDRNGQQKNRYENIGVVLQGNEGPYLMLKRTFNPAGVTPREGSDSILVSLFTPRDDAAAAPARPMVTGDEEIPF